MSLSVKERKVRKTFNITEKNAVRMEKFLPPRKQTDFVNKALSNEFEKLEDEKKRQKLIEKMRNIKTVKSDEPVEETVRKLRDGRSEHLYNLSFGKS